MDMDLGTLTTDNIRYSTFSTYLAGYRKRTSLPIYLRIQSRITITIKDSYKEVLFHNFFFFTNLTQQLELIVFNLTLDKG